jgi:hypothetical protein
MSPVGFLIFDGLWREISARVSRFVRSASGGIAEKRRNLARSKMRGFLRARCFYENLRRYCESTARKYVEAFYDWIERTIAVSPHSFPFYRIGPFLGVPHFG